MPKIWTGPTTGNPKPIIYLGGSEFCTRPPYDRVAAVMRFCCLSYFNHALLDRAPEFLAGYKARGVRCFLDSGAFTYQMQLLRKRQILSKAGAERLIDAYADWVLRADFLFDFIVTFDYERDVDTVLWTTQQLEKRGLAPLPVYHQKSPITALHRLIDCGYEFIGIGGMIPRKAKYILPFLDQVFNVSEKRGVRLHGFGIGEGRELTAYPWFSVDSTTWLYVGKLGYTYLPDSSREFPGVRTATSGLRVSVGRKLHASQKLAPGEAVVARHIANANFWNSVDLSQKQSKHSLKRPLF